MVKKILGTTQVALPPFGMQISTINFFYYLSFQYMIYTVWDVVFKPLMKKYQNEEKKNDKGKDGKKGEKKKSRQDSGMNFWVSQFGGNYKPEKPTNLKFSDVIGIEEHLEEQLELVDFLQRPGDYIKAGAQLPKGLLLTGKPGVGKTMLARALVGEAQCSFFYAAGSEFNEVFMGMGSNRIKKLFESAREHSFSCQVFRIDMQQSLHNTDISQNKLEIRCI